MTTRSRLIDRSIHRLEPSCNRLHCALLFQPTENKVTGLMIDAPLYGGIEGGGTKFVCAVGASPDRIGDSATIPTTDARSTLSECVRFFVSAQKRHGQITAFGVGCFGPIDLRSDTADFGRMMSTPKQGWSAALVYPVVTMLKPWTHDMSRVLLLGAEPSAAQVERRSPELHVDAATPPVFIVHAMDDLAVPVENSLRMMNAMRTANRPVEAHLLQEGGHAFGTGRPRTPSASWPDLFHVWLMRSSNG